MLLLRSLLLLLLVSCFPQGEELQSLLRFCLRVKM